MSRADEILSLVEQRPIPVDRILNVLAEAARARQEDDLEGVLRLAKMSGMFDEQLAIPAIASLPAWGEVGFEMLRGIVVDGFHSDTAQQIIFGLAAGIALERAQIVGVSKEWFAECGIIGSDEMIGIANRLTLDLALSAKTDSRLRDKIVHNLSFSAGFTQAGRQIADFFFDLLMESSLTLNRESLKEFQELLEVVDAKEEKLHKLLFDNTIFLDLLASEIRSKQ
jgi:hypothetical protein